MATLAIIVPLLTLVVIASFLAGLKSDNPKSKFPCLLTAFLGSFLLIIVYMTLVVAEAAPIKNESALKRLEIYEVIGESAAQDDAFLVFLKDREGKTIPFRLPVNPPKIFKLTTDGRGEYQYTPYPIVSPSPVKQASPWFAH